MKELSSPSLPRQNNTPMSSNSKSANAGKSKRQAGRFALGVVVPAILLVLWQLLGQSPGMAGIVPTPVKVAQAWWDWIFGDPGMGLNP